MAHGAHATRRSDAQAREPPPGELGRPPVGTAPRSGESGAMLTERKRGRARERHLLGWGQRRDGNHPGVWRYATPPASGGLCRPEVRRSKPSPRFLSLGDVRFPLSRTIRAKSDTREERVEPSAQKQWRRTSGSPPARPGGKCERGNSPFHKSTTTNRNLPPPAGGGQGSFDCRREAPGGSGAGA